MSAAAEALRAYARSQLPADATVDRMATTWTVVAGVSDFRVIIQYNTPSEGPQWLTLDAGAALAAVLIETLGGPE